MSQKNTSKQQHYGIQLSAPNSIVSSSMGKQTNKQTTTKNPTLFAKHNNSFITQMMMGMCLVRLWSAFLFWFVVFFIQCLPSSSHLATVFQQEKKQTQGKRVLFIFYYFGQATNEVQNTLFIQGNNTSTKTSRWDRNLGKIKMTSSLQ